MLVKKEFYAMVHATGFVRQGEVRRSAKGKQRQENIVVLLYFYFFNIGRKV